MTHTPEILALFDIGGNEIVIILILALVLFGGDKMPELARGIGKGIREFKKAASGVEQELKKAMEEPPPAKKPAPPMSQVYTPPPPLEHFHEGLTPPAKPAALEAGPTAATPSEGSSTATPKAPDAGDNPSQGNPPTAPAPSA